jgi:hypothetical protein
LIAGKFSAAAPQQYGVPGRSEPGRSHPESIDFDPLGANLSRNTRFVGQGANS